MYANTSNSTNIKYINRGVFIKTYMQFTMMMLMVVRLILMMTIMMMMMVPVLGGPTLPSGR